MFYSPTFRQAFSYFVKDNDVSKSIHKTTLAFCGSQTQKYKPHIGMDNRLRIPG